MTNQEIAPELIEFAMPLVERTAHKIKVRDELRNVDVEDIQQDLMLHVCERAPSFDPELGTVQAFVTQVVVNGVGMLLRKMSRQRDNPNDGAEVTSLSEYVDSPDQKSEQRIVGMSLDDGDRRRQTESRDPIADIELSDAVDERIATLPEDLRPIARELMFSNQKETAAKLELSRREMMAAMRAIRKHFGDVEWTEK
ncbi:Sigma-70 region 2 [Rubripirellula obstinata]|uniref:Sigma-70 region 2 n=1 Tax=Rubripirellula obstinata TaxID=406547 RepID=A0A5B1CFP5_9BACT|nr:sigma-70 family RNA polymerase sigma factor [Rubripirellula obstinata]KAA1258313.1 Sigma-70 region 2 [Rubripirellula obstinata]